MPAPKHYGPRRSRGRCVYGALSGGLESWPRSAAVDCVAFWRKCDSNLHQTGGGSAAGVSGRRVGVGEVVSDQTRQAPAQALDLPLVLLELDLAGAALLENRAREDKTFDP
jgi:hypothetical protein